jgi:hypothetical protein
MIVLTVITPYKVLIFRTALLWVVTQWVVAISYQLFRLSQNVGNILTTTNFVIIQKRALLTYFMAEAWKHGNNFCFSILEDYAASIFKVTELCLGRDGSDWKGRMLCQLCLGRDGNDWKGLMLCQLCLGRDRSDWTGRMLCQLCLGRDGSDWTGCMLCQLCLGRGGSDWKGRMLCQLCFGRGGSDWKGRMLCQLCLVRQKWLEGLYVMPVVFK